MPAKLRFQIEETTRKNRLDRFLFERLTEVSKIFVSNRIDAGFCSVNGQTQARGYHLRAGDAVEIEIDLTARTAMLPEDIPLDVVYEDDEIIVVDKPAEMLVHPSKNQKTGTLLNALAFYLNRDSINAATEAPEIRNQKSATVRPGLVHRLDRQTSGLTVVAKTQSALSFLSRHFQKRLVKKKYLAIVGRIVEEDCATIREPIGYFDEEKIWNVKADGKAAETNLRVLERFSNATLLELEPVTGRTNQLRIHCASIKHPIVGDRRYGGDEFFRLCLHAARLGFYHPTSNEWLEFESAPPFDTKAFSGRENTTDKNF